VNTGTGEDVTTYRVRYDAPTTARGLAGCEKQPTRHQSRRRTPTATRRSAGTRSRRAGTTSRDRSPLRGAERCRDPRRSSRDWTRSSIC